MKLNYKRTILVGFAFFLISAFWQAYDAIVPLILTNHFGLPQTASGAVMSIDNVLAVFMLPIFGALSDKAFTKFGRRKPFIFVGTLAAVFFFVFLAAVDIWQLNNIIDAGFVTRYDNAQLLLNAAKDAVSDAKLAGDAVAEEAARALVKTIEESIDAIRAEVLEATLSNIWPLISFIAVLLLVLVSMATFRSPAVALMPDVTLKPLRSKGNAIINLMGTAGGIIVLVLGMVFGTSKKLAMSYIGFVCAVIGIMLIGLVIFITTVRENKWAGEMADDTARFGLDEVKLEDGGSEPARALSRAELKSLLLILASVALWYIGYNSVTSKYSVYATDVLGFDFNSTLIVAQAAAVISYIPVGIISSQLGRRKTILIGIGLLAAAFFAGNFITRDIPEFIMMPIFALAGIGWATINVNSFPMVVELAKGGDVGKYTGYYYTASMAAQIVAPIASGILYDIFGINRVFFVFATVFVAASFVTMLLVKHGDARPERMGVLESLGADED